MTRINGHEVCLLALNSNRSLAKEISNYLGVPLANCAVNHFADGEINLDIQETVRGKDCFVVQSTSAPVNDNYMEVLIMIDALKRASARTINIIMPYYGYCRQDRKATSHQPISAKLMADLLTVSGATRLFCMDLHAAQIQGFFNIPIDNFSSIPVMTSYFLNKKIENLVIVSPDHGGATRARKFSAGFNNAPLAIIDKRRPRPNACEALSVIGDVNGKNCIIVDDIIDTAGSVTSAVEILKKNGAKDVYLAITHPLLNGPAIERLQKSSIKELVTTNTIELPPEKKIDKIVQLSVANLLGEGVMRVLKDQGLSDLFSYDPKFQALGGKQK